MHTILGRILTLENSDVMGELRALTDEQVANFMKRYRETGSLNPTADQDRHVSPWGLRLNSFIDQWRGITNQKPFRLPSNVQELVCFGQLCADVQLFISAYVPSVYEDLGHSRKSPLVIPHEPKHQSLSSDERQRLERAFFRWELQCRLYGTSYLDNSTSNDIRVIGEVGDKYYAATGLMKHLSAWEAEEMICVDQFIRGQHRLLFNNHFVSHVKTAMRDLGVEESPIITCDEWHAGRALGTGCRSRAPNYHGYISMLLYSGLGFLKHLLRSSTPSREEFYRSTIGGDQFPAGPNYLPTYPVYMERFSRQERESDDTAGWTREEFWEAILPPRCKHLFSGPDKRSLRDAGWVFWDQQRLDATRMLEFVAEKRTEPFKPMFGKLRFNDVFARIPERDYWRVLAHCGITKTTPPKRYHPNRAFWAKVKELRYAETGDLSIDREKFLRD